MIRRVESRQDLERCVAICNAVQPDEPVRAEQLVGSDGTFLLYGDDGYAYVDRSSVPGSAYGMVRVRPEARRRGVGSGLLEAVRVHAREAGFERVWGRVSEAAAGSLRFALARGFEEVTREVTVLREVVPGDGETAPGIVELREEHLRGAHRVCVECIPEIHLPQQAEAPPFPEWVEREAKGSPVAFVALDARVPPAQGAPGQGAPGGEVVGYARLYETGLPHRLENGLTAVLPSHRRRGIATALKRAQLSWAAAHGYRELVSEMVDANAPMRAVNERLGYRPLPASIIVSGSVS